MEYNKQTVGAPEVNAKLYESIDTLKGIGVLFPPVRVGDTCYACLDGDSGMTEICAFAVCGILWDGKNFFVTEDFGTFEQLGKEVFVTEREAETELARLMLKKEKEKKKK